LKNTFYKKLPYISLNSETEKREILVAPVLLELMDHIEIDIDTVADFYRYRWQVKLFFKWIKQHLRIKSFFGTSENAVKSQIWIAIPVYILVAIIKKRLDRKLGLYTILRILSLTLFENTLASSVGY